MEATMSLIRHIMTFGGGILVANSHLSATDLETWVATLTALIGLGWSQYDKRAKKAALDAAIKAPAGKAK